MWEVWKGGEATSDKVARKAFLSRECTECIRHHLCKRLWLNPACGARGAEWEGKGQMEQDAVGLWEHRCWE